MPDRVHPTAGPPPVGFDSLVNAQSAAIYGYLWRMLRDCDDAEDALQDTFLRAYRAYGRLNGHTNPRAWLYRIATNVARTRLKQRGREAVRTAALEPDLVAGGPGPAEQASHNALLETIAAAVDDLPHQQRAALILRQYQGLSYDQIAAILECSPDSARANVYQGMRKLKAVISN